jgi:hypothetical protein
MSKGRPVCGLALDIIGLSLVLAVADYIFCQLKLAAALYFARVGVYWVRHTLLAFSAAAAVSLAAAAPGASGQDA